MTTARLLSDPPLVAFDPETGLRQLARELALNLGACVVELHLWKNDLFIVNALEPEIDAGVQRDGSGFTVLRIPSGFTYDGASIPPLSQRILMGPRELYECAGCAHDWLYRVQAPRRAADHVFWIVARSGSKRVGPVRAWLGWAALRLFGWVAYRAHGS